MRQEIFRLRLKGMKVVDIAKKFGISKPRVYQLLNQPHLYNEDCVRTELTNNGWLVLKGGYPDFFCYHPEKNEFKFVEVKGEFDNLSPIQETTISYLKKANFNVEIVRSLPNNQIILYEKTNGKNKKNRPR